MATHNQTFNPTVKFLIAVSAGVIVLWGIREASEMIVQVALATIITVTFTPLLYALIRKGVPPMVSYALTLVAIILLFGFLIVILTVAVNRFVTEIPNYNAELDSAVDETNEFFKDTFGIERLDTSALLDQMNPKWVLETAANIFSGLVARISSVVVIVIVTVFMLIDALSIHEKLLPHLESGNVVVEKLSDFGGEIRRYIGITTIVGAATGLIDTLFFILMGVDFPILWGILAFIMSFVPTLGFWLALIPPVFLAFLENGLASAIIVFIGIVLINGFAENVIKPKYMAEGLDLSPFIVVFSVIFWAAILGPFGAILSVPLTMTFKMLILENDPANRWLADLMSAGPHEPAEKMEESATPTN